MLSGYENSLIKALVICIEKQTQTNVEIANTLKELQTTMTTVEQTLSNINNNVNRISQQIDDLTATYSTKNGDVQAFRCALSQLSSW